MKKYVLFASAILAFASCASDSFTGTDEAGRVAQGEKPISFGFDVPAATRAEGAVAAGKLNNQFIVWGEKNETEAAPAAGNFVFPDYKVAYTANTAYTTTSNTKDWEYVGLSWTSAEAANITEAKTAVTTNVQTIKYWDYAATSYTFTAVSAKPADISGDKVKINKLTSGPTVYDKGYEVAVTADADLASLYFADRVNITKSDDKDRTQSNKYGGNVKFTFRNGLSQVRVGMYETIPGYDVKVTKFYYDADATTDANKPAFSEMTDESTTNFVANVPSTATGVAGKFTVKYYDNTVASIKNHPTISFAPTTATDSKQYIILGDQITAATSLGVTSTAATYDKADGTDPGTEPDFTSVFPQETNNKNLKLKVDYQLKNTVTGEIINITGKTAEVPAQYLQWKPNFKYTYLFKINDNDLYPITFDAVVIEAENGEVEYITTVSKPSITTFGVKDSKYVHGGSEYAAGSDIYATIEDASSVINPTLGTNVNLYKGITAGATEASLAEAIAEVSAKTHSVAFTLDNTIGTKVTSVPTETGSTTTINAVKMAGLAAGTYAVEYVKTARTYKFVEVTIADDTEFTTAKAALNLYEDNTGTTAVGDSDTYDSAKHYYKKVVDNVGAYAYKVIVVQ